ncbi:MAG: nicotinate-nucleotide adenylyltransferase [Sphingomonadales bacterium]|nr:nicotinate-nucleotide adenylyltransferase [Sphingomonadales bacterium]MDE2170029.1 nicotinate-nucleotide adenylyltransferase [Sphingomonadales bacterium]
MRRIGILGGSFNPAHGGHRRISLRAASALGLDEVWWLVSPGNPLKPVEGMAPLPMRVASARAQARRAPIRVSAIEREFGTRYTRDTLVRLRRRYPRDRFIWLMGADNLAQFQHWHRWRDIARCLPIAVIARPGYNSHALAAPAMAWLGRFRRPVASLTHLADRGRADWSAPALVLLAFDPDPRSASAIRQADPDWASRFQSEPGQGVVSLRDGLTHRLITSQPYSRGRAAARNNRP